MAVNAITNRGELNFNSIFIADIDWPALVGSGNEVKFDYAAGRLSSSLEFVPS
jgi:hypothetical protein